MIEGIVVVYLVNAAWMTCAVAGTVTLLSISMKRVHPLCVHRLWVAALACVAFLPLAALPLTFPNGAEGGAASFGAVAPPSAPGEGPAPSVPGLPPPRRPP